MLVSMIRAVVFAVVGSGTSQPAPKNARVMEFLSPMKATLIGSPACQSEAVVTEGSENKIPAGLSRIKSPINRNMKNDISEMAIFSAFRTPRTAKVIGRRMFRMPAKSYELQVQ